MRPVILVLTLVLAVAATGCGSKSAKQEYVDKLNAMCENFADRAQALGNDPAERGDRVVAAFDTAIAEPIKQLQAPQEIAPEAARLREVVAQQRDVLQGLADAGRAGDVTRVRRLAVRNQLLTRQAGEIANELDADSCASAG